MYTGCSTQSGPSWSNSAMRSSGGTKFSLEFKSQSFRRRRSWGNDYGRCQFIEVRRRCAAFRKILAVGAELSAAGGDLMLLPENSGIPSKEWTASPAVSAIAC